MNIDRPSGDFQFTEPTRPGPLGRAWSGVRRQMSNAIIFCMMKQPSPMTPAQIARTTRPVSVVHSSSM